MNIHETLKGINMGDNWTEIENQWIEIANGFCPTGQGGGVDPTCSGPSGSAPFQERNEKWAEQLPLDKRRRIEAWALDRKYMEKIKGTEMGFVTSKAALKELKEFNKIYDSAPKFQGMVYRGVSYQAGTPEMLSSAVEGSELQLGSFSSASSSKAVADDFATFYGDPPAEYGPPQQRFVLVLKTKSGMVNDPALTRVAPGPDDYPRNQKEVVISGTPKYRVTKTTEQTLDVDSIPVSGRGFGSRSTGRSLKVTYIHAEEI